MELEGLEIFREIEQQFFEDEQLETAPPREVQIEGIREAFSDIPELRREVWETLSMEERVAALEQLEKQVAAITCRTPVEVQVLDLEPGLNGYFSNTDQSITLSLNNLDNYEQTLDTFFHEGRHAYQYAASNSFPSIEKDEQMVDVWRTNLALYESGETGLFGAKALVRQYGFYRYYTQPVEVDARSFAADTMRALGITET